MTIKDHFLTGAYQVINVFEGSRRIALFIAATVSLGAAVSAFLQDPYVSLKYNVESPSSGFTRTDQSCPIDAHSHYFTIEPASRGVIGISLCLLPAKEIKSKSLIFYRLPSRGVVGAAPNYSEAVSEYADELEKRFAVPPADMVPVQIEISERYRKNWIDTLLYLLIGLVAYWLIIWTIGWIVRGFLSIPRGKDHR